MISTYFLSYSRKDSDLVDEFIKTSQLFNFDLWIDKEEQEYGQKWRNQLYKGIFSSNGAILLISSNSLKSDVINNIEIPFIFEQQKNRGDEFKVFIVIIDYVPETLLNNYQSTNGEYIFKDRHIKNVSANKLDTEKQLPSEMMVGARKKYWYSLCSKISEENKSDEEVEKIATIDKELLNSIDLDGDGHVTKEEFDAHMNLKKKEIENSLLKSFVEKFLHKNKE